MPFIKWTFPLLFGIFLLSVLVRLPQLNRPLSKHHEFCTALSLRVMQIWYDNGIEKYNFNPVMTFNNPADKYINNNANTTDEMIDKDGNYYYVSHPPFAYYFPFFIFKLLHIRPDVLPLQIFNLCLHFISGLFVYFIVCLLSLNRGRSMPYRSAIVAYSIYIFLPATLWFQGNVYMSDMAVQVLFIIGVYIALKMIIRERFYSLKYIFFYIVCLALMIYTSWLGIFFAFGVFVYSLLHVRANKAFRVLIWTTVITAALMLRLVAYQYSQINGLLAYFDEMLNRYIVRSGLEGADQGLFHFMFSYLLLIKTLLFNYILHYIIVYLIIALFIWFALSRKKLKIVFSDNGYRFIWLAVLPVALLHIVFLNYSVQDFTVLYASLFFSVVLGILYDKIKKSGAISLRKMQMGLFIVILLMTAQYEWMNYKYDAEPFLTGKDIKNITTKDEVLFSYDPSIQPQLIFYAQRNIKYIKSRDEAFAFLKSRNIRDGEIVGERAEKISMAPALAH